MASDDRRTSRRWCPGWGELGVGNLKECRTHIDCPCECSVCSRARAADRMPIIRDGKVVRHP